MVTARWKLGLVGAAAVIGVVVVALVVTRSRDASSPSIAAATSAPTASPSTPATSPSTPTSTTPSPPSAPSTDAAGEPDDELTRLAKRSHDVAVQRIPGNYELHTIEGFARLHLGSGAPTIKPLEPSSERTRSISGRVIDRAGAPVGNAIVLANRSFHIRRSDLMAIGGTVTAADGTFSIAAPLETAFAVAIVERAWSDVVRIGDGELELRMLGHGALRGRFTYDDEPETFAVQLAMQDRPFEGSWETESDGTLQIDSLPPGRFRVTVGKLQGAGGGVSRTQQRDITIVDGETVELTLEFGAGTTIAITAKPPAKREVRVVSYWLITTTAPRGGVEARARAAAEGAPSQGVGGAAKLSQEFHDVAPGTYFACAALFDVDTMAPADRPFGCTKLVVESSDFVREVEVVLVD